MREQQIHEGTLVLDHHKRYCICGPGLSAPTLTSGCRAAVLLGGYWLHGHVEGDGQEYWLFLQGGGKFKLAEGMTARYVEPGWYAADREAAPLAIMGS